MKEWKVLSAAQHERASRDRILEAARTLFSRKGFHQTSVAEVATAAQVSVGLIYRSFNSKDDIISAIVEVDAVMRDHMICQLCDRLKTGQCSIEQTFEALFLNVTDEGDEALSFDILAEAFRNPRVGETISSLCNRLRQTMREFARVANPRLSGDDLAAAEELILASMFGLGHRTLAQPELSADRTAKGAARMIVAALRGIA
ncbi:TetR/AcrR family transcriptional regulator [Sphingobium mellinum]|uniref:TetR/AcrR family transcriptional regulator n=1 Tax=Sphingobium mellinum TaxID=1387166 RepID=UPI0030EB68F7